MPFTRMKSREERISERVEYARRPLLFGTHPIQGDAWHLAAVDRSGGPGIQVFDTFLMSSLDHRGATGPSLVWHFLAAYQRSAIAVSCIGGFATCFFAGVNKLFQ